MASTPAPCTQPLTGCAFAESRPMRFVLHHQSHEGESQFVHIVAKAASRMHVLVRGANGVDVQRRREGFRQTFALHQWQSCETRGAVSLDAGRNQEKERAETARQVSAENGRGRGRLRL